MDVDVRINSNSSLPLAAQISEQLRWLIHSGSLSAGDELPPATELARDLNVNFHTVRAAYQMLNQQALVSMGRGRRTKVLGVDRTNHSWPDSVVRTYSIGVLIPEFAQQYSQLIAGIESEAALQPNLVYVANAHDKAATALTYLDRFLARGVDGIIVAAALIDPDVDLPNSGPPVIFIDSPGAPAPSIEFDLEKSQYMATRHLIEHGHERIGYITPSVTLANVAPKLQGHKKALVEAGLEYHDDDTVQVDDFKPSSGRAAALRLLDQARPPTAITATSDGLAFGIYGAARRLGMSIPGDVAVTSNDNTETAELVHPSLTTTTLPLRRAGQIAVQQLELLKDGARAADRISLDIDLVVRESCGHEDASP